MNITITGTITDIFSEEVYGNFSKRIFWVKEDAGEYPNHYELQVTQAKCSILDKYRTGDKVNCTVDVKGKHYNKNGKEGCINSLVCWKIEKIGQTAAPVSNTASSNNDQPDDLPF